MPIETYILIDFVMNFAIIATVARSRGHVDWRRVTFASAFGSVYAVAMKSGWFPQLNGMGAKIVLAAVTSAVSFKSEGIRSYFTGTLLLLGATVFVGGVVSMAARLFGRSAAALGLGALTGVISLSAALTFREGKAIAPQAQVTINYAGQKVSLSAMIDTGNRLREPISGLPVMIVEYRVVKRMMPRDFDAARPRETLPADFRLSSFDSLGSRGIMALFRPDELLVSYGDGWLKAQDIWVGVYPGAIPGLYRAIAPAVIGRIRQQTGENRIIKHFEGSCKKWITPRNRQ